MRLGVGLLFVLPALSIALLVPAQPHALTWRHPATQWRRHVSTVSMTNKPKKLPRGTVVDPVTGEFSEDWTTRIFNPVNAGPWLILVTVILFEGLQLAVRLEVIPRESLPSFVQAAIPLVLGKQYELPPS